MSSSSLLCAINGNSTNFYVNLPSSTRVEGNTPARFRVRFARKLHFNSVWSVALAEISYPHSWPSLGTSEPQFVDIVWRQGIPQRQRWTPNEEWSDAYEDIEARLLPRRTRIDIPRGRHPTAERLESALRTIVGDAGERLATIAEQQTRDAEFTHIKVTLDEREKAEFASMIADARQRCEELRRVWRHVNFVFNADTQRFHVEFNTTVIERLELSQQLAYILGYEAQQLETSGAQAHYSPDMLGGISELYVYAPGLIEPVIVGDVMAPLLRIVVVRGRPEEMAHDTYVQPHYHKLLVKEVAEILIELRTSTGRLVPFEYGACRLTLHFKKQFYF